MFSPNHSTRLMLLMFAFVVSRILLPATSYAQGQVAATAPPKPPEIHAILEKVVHPNRIKVGGAITARMTEPTKLRDGTEIAKGTHILGKVTEIKRKADKEGPSKLGLLFDRAQLKDGRLVLLHDGAGQRCSALGARRSRPSRRRQSGRFSRSNRRHAAGCRCRWRDGSH